MTHLESPRGKRKYCLLAPRSRQQSRPSQESRAMPKVILGGSKGTADGLKRKTEVGPMPSQSKKRKKRKVPLVGVNFGQDERENLL